MVWIKKKGIMKTWIAHTIVKYRIPILAVVILFTVFGAFSIKKTRINYDLARYLSEETMTQRALKIMQEEFGSSEQLRLMFSDQDDESLAGIRSSLEALPEILAVSFNPETDVKEDGGTAWQLFTLTLRECDAMELTKQIRGMFPQAGTYYVGGSAPVQMDLQRLVAKEIPAVMAVSVAVVLAVLLLTSYAWLEPAVILLVLAVSIIINMGTNFIFPDVSYITFAVSAILQLALSIDYAIMLLHSFHACRDELSDPELAMEKALGQSFMRISSSAFTTIAGLAALLFMSYTIGFDIGVVLSKGILISMLCVFLLMPSIILLLEGPLRLTRHKPVKLGGEVLAGFIVRIKKPAAIVLVLLVLCGAYLSSRNTYMFTYNGAAKGSEGSYINQIFGASSPLVLLVPGSEEDEDYERQRTLVDKLLAIKRENAEPAVDSISAMVTTGAEALRYITAADVARMTGMNQLAVDVFFRLNGFEGEVRADRLLSAAGDLAEENEQIQHLKGQLELARSVFIGQRYGRMLMELKTDLSDPDFNDTMKSVLDVCREVYGDDYYVTGVPMSAFDIGNAFQSDLMKVNFITLLSILIIVTISFHSVRRACFLVFVIEGAIWITMGISKAMNQPIFFMSYLICLAIQMGATIDYGILLCDQYRNCLRETQDASDAIKEAMKRSLPTILTSGLILITAGYLIGKVCSIYYISSIGALISRGATVSVFLVLTLLSCLLASVSSLWRENPHQQER